MLALLVTLLAAAPLLEEKRDERSGGGILLLLVAPVAHGWLLHHCLLCVARVLCSTAPHEDLSVCKWPTS